MASGYAIFPRSIYNEPAIRSLTDRGKVLLPYAACGTHSNMIGAFLLPDEYIADAMCWPLKTVSQTVSELSGIGFIRRFEDGRHLVVCRHFEWNTIQNQNVMKAALKLVAELPPDPAVQSVLDNLEPHAKRFDKPFDERSGNSSGICFQDQLAMLRERLLRPSANTLSVPFSISSIAPARGENQQEGFEDDTETRRAS